MRARTIGSVGILAADRSAEPGFASEEYHRQLCNAGAGLGLDVFVFTPACILAGGQDVIGFQPDADTGGWRRSNKGMPKLVYDRHFAAAPAEAARYREALRQLTAMAGVRLLGCGLPGKRQVQRMLQRDPSIAPHLPQTSMLRSAKQLLTWMEHYGELFLKPDGGSQGRGALYMRSVTDGTVEIKGRTPGNAMFVRRFRRADDAAAWVLRAAAGRPYLIQPYLTLTDSGGASYDIRCLTQKDGAGRWQLTGMAVRRGQPGSITANLHGGGTAEAAEPFLSREFGTEASLIHQTLLRLSANIPSVLEEQQGRLVELGIDFGVDRGGRVWLLEVNSKPGRSSFTRIGRPETRRDAVLNPLHYARFLCSPASPSGALVIKNA